MGGVLEDVDMVKRIIKALRRLWLIGTCDHINCGRQIEWDETTSLTVCKRCGTVMQIVLSEANKGTYTKVCQ